MPAEVVHISPPVPPPLPPGAGARPLPPPVERDPNLCANRDQPLHGPFCSNCGQHVSDIHRSVWRFVVDGEGRGRTVAKVCLLGAMHLLALFTGLAIAGGLSLYHALG